MNDHIGALLDAYLDGELPASKMNSVATHLASCEMCQNEVNKRQRLLALLKEASPVAIIKPTPQFVSETDARLMRKPSSKPIYLKVLKLGWQALPIGLLLATIFINIVSLLSMALFLVPDISKELIGNFTGLPIDLSVSNSLQIFLDITGIFRLPEWNWMTGMIAFTIISLIYISWLVVWWVQNQPAITRQLT